ncbi:MAG TPA: hypothetical protein VJR89_05225 [Polyangiales bacterium]|nr:hypothetical protein [Polyangiales bacterium]
MDDQRWIAVSPRHKVRLASEYQLLLEHPPQRDFVVRTIEQREANGLPLMAAEIVIAGAQTRREYALAEQYPLHFRKTYFAGRLHGDPRIEYEASVLASHLVGLPPPIGYTGQVYRSCLVPGSPYSRLSPFDLDSEDSSLRRCDSLPLAAAAGLWRLAEEAWQMLEQLHAGGLAHGDAELQNFVVCTAPLEVVLIDFETAVRREDVDEAAWKACCAKDRGPLLKQAIFLQAVLGRQPGEYADQAWDAAPRLFRDAARLRRAIDQLGDLKS